MPHLLPRNAAALTASALLFTMPVGLGAAALPVEPMEIGTTPQFFIDDYVVDNRWALKPKKEEVVRAFHAPQKDARNPVIAGEGGYVTAVRDAESGVFQLWYQLSQRGEEEEGTAKAIACAESKDGLSWSRPELGLHEWKGTKANNIVWQGVSDARASGLQILRMPEGARRGYRYVLAYRTSGAGRGNAGIRLVGSADGKHWDKDGDTLLIELGSDTVNSIVFDPARQEDAMFCRPKDRYLVTRGDVIDSGESRRIARLASQELWTKWTGTPQTILIPDELDLERGFNRFSGMPATVHAGITWGFLWCFKLNSDIWTELTSSRDGLSFQRLPARPRPLDLSPEGAWDDGMVFGSPDWIEVGDEWWIYFSGWNGPGGNPTRDAGIGLARLRKEGFVSLRGPRGGGVVCTRLLRWPGGDLVLNADARRGELKVRISDERRKVLPGFDYAGGPSCTGDGVNQVVTWQGRSLHALQGRNLRIEFFLRDADLCTFRAAGAPR